jgi:proteasome lid subunit RPN8/RPN11
MLFFKKKKENYISSPKSWKITKECFSMISESAKSMYPKEFGGLLRCDDEQRDTITEIVLLPGTIAGESHAIFRMHMKPFDLSIVGTVHSHPSRSFFPSEADKQLFRKYGKVHIIIGSPYTINSWQGYDQNGEPIAVHII